MVLKSKRPEKYGLSRESAVGVSGLRGFFFGSISLGIGAVIRAHKAESERYHQSSPIWIHLNSDNHLLKLIDPTIWSRIDAQGSIPEQRIQGSSYQYL